MVRSEVLPMGLIEHEFAEMARTEPHAATRLRYLGMAHIQNGKRYTEVAKALKVHAKTVRGWLMRFAACGLEGLKEQPHSGARRKLPAAQDAAFKGVALGTTLSILPRIS